MAMGLLCRAWNARALRVRLGAFAVLAAAALAAIPAQARFTQQSLKLVGTGAIGDAFQGSSVALSGDGNTAIVGGPTDNSLVGAAWVYVRIGGVWTRTPDGGKLVGAGAVGISNQGRGVALSADGNTAIVGGDTDNGGDGAAWLFRRSRAGVWTQLGQKLVGTVATGDAGQGRSVALSGDGNSAIVGGPEDDGSTTGANAGVAVVGAVWVFGRPAVDEVFPNAGTVDGGTNVVIFGSNLRDVTGVTFGGVPATDVFEFSPGAVFATTPPRAAGRANVIVTTRTGSGRLRRGRGYTYQRHATATSLASSQSPSRAGQRVRFTATVSANGNPARGRVTFELDGQVLGTRRLRGGVATIVARDLAAGAHRVRAIFLPNGVFASSRDVLRQRVRN